MKRVTKIILSASGIVLLAGSVAACSHHRHSPEQRAQWMMNKVTKELKLDSAQQAKFKTLSDDMLAARKEMHQQFGNDHEQVLSLLSQPKLDQSKVLDMVHEHTKAINDKAPKIVADLGSFYDSLSPKQQAEVRKFVKERHEHRHHWDHD